MAAQPPRARRSVVSPTRLAATQRRALAFHLVARADARPVRTGARRRADPRARGADRPRAWPRHSAPRADRERTAAAARRERAGGARDRALEPAARVRPARIVSRKSA